jgi:hypothetical protein
MGVIHKLKPEIRQFILDEKKGNPALSCRKLSFLLLQKFQADVSKSSINSVFKEAGLSMPVGRTRLKKKESLKEAIQETLKLLVNPEELPKAIFQTQLQPEMQCTGAILLKAADFLIGGSRHIAELIKNGPNTDKNNILAKTEGLIYFSLFQEPQENQISKLQALIGQRISFEDINSYLIDLQRVTSLKGDIFQAIEALSKEARCIKIDFSTNDSSYIDGHMYTVWSTPHTPYSFSTTICNANSYIDKHFNDNSPLVLFTAPGYNAPTKEFFNLILGLESQAKEIAGVKIYGNNLEELNSIYSKEEKKRFFVFAMWPWQFIDYRKVIKIGEFKPFYFEPLKLNLYLSEIEIELSQQDAGQSVILKGCALKTMLSEKTRMVILSNFAFGEGQSEKLANIYLSRWPNLGETFQDYSRKVELFTYTDSSQRFLPSECIKQLQNAPHLKAAFENYLEILDLYVRWHFLPEEFKDKEFPAAKEHFYGLSAIMKKEGSRTIVKFNPPEGYLFLKELEYACHRINEREIFFEDNSRLWCLP